MKDNLDVAKGIQSGILIGAIIWGMIIVGVWYAWRHFITPTQQKINKVVEIERNFYGYR